MTDELPPLWALDRAAKAANYVDWTVADNVSYPTARRSIIAHARTIAQYEQPPVDEDAESTARIIAKFLNWQPENVTCRDQHFLAALAQFKRELEGRK